MRTYSEALGHILSFSRSFGSERLGISASLAGRVLAGTIPADRDYPPFNRSTMDGYALHSSDLDAGIDTFTLLEEVFAGRPATKKIGPGECYKIMTGAMVPDQANLVIKREDVQDHGGQVTISREGLRPFLNIARQGEDIKKGQPLLFPGIPFDASIAGALAVVGAREADFCRLPRVSLFSSGDELIDIGGTPLHYQIRNSNSPMLASMLYKYGIVPERTIHFPDQQQVIFEGLEAAMDADILILSGAVSAGDADFIPSTLKRLGVKEEVYKVGLKPGKPIWFGVKPGGPVVFALPGNPLSSQVTFKLFAEPFLRKCLGLKEMVQLQIPVLMPRVKKVPFDEFFTASIENSPYGLRAGRSMTSGDIGSSIGSDGIGWHKASRISLEPGEYIPFFPW